MIGCFACFKIAVLWVVGCSLLCNCFVAWFGFEVLYVAGLVCCVAW